MEVTGIVPESTVCPSCGGTIILAGREGLTHMDCPHCGTPTVVPLQFGGFLLLHAVGFGGMGTVYKAMDLSLNRLLAIKILRKKLAANEQFMENFQREARAAAAVNHPNVAKVYSFGEHNGQCYLVMELLERGSLDDRLTKIGKVPEKEVLDIGIQIAQGLKAAYETGLLHRDVKPGNILFNEQGIPKIVDFGLARPADSAATAGKEPIWGTPYYIAPEKLLGYPEDFRSDIYSLGATLFHAMAGRPPFDAATATDVAVKHATTPAYSLKTYLPTVQDTTANVIGRMLAKNPSERYASYDELIADLQRAKAVLEEIEKQRGIVTQTGERISIFSLVGTVAILVLLIGVGIFFLVFRHKLFPESAPPPSPQIITQRVETTTIKTEDVDFGENQPWGTAWTEAAKKLAAGRMAEATLAYEALQRQLRFQPNHLRWLLYAEGIVLYLNNQPQEAQAAFTKAEDPLVQPRVPLKITPINFVSPLASVMLHKMSPASMDKAITNMPPWAAALANFNLGLLELQGKSLAKPQSRFEQFADATPDPERKWAYAFQPLATQLAKDCSTVSHTIDEAEKLYKENKLPAAIKILQDKQSQIKIPLLKTHLQTGANTLKKRDEELRRQQEQARLAAEARAREEQERKRQEEERKRLARLRELAEADAKVLAATDAVTARLLAAFDFKGLLSQYESLESKLQSDDGRAQLAQRLARARALANLKTQLMAGFARQPLDGTQLQQASGSPFIGKLARATDTELIFSLPEGEALREWRDLTPGSIARMADHYARLFAATEKPEETAARYLSLAVFCKQYGLTQFVETYAQQAIKLHPPLKDELTKALGN